MRGDHLYTNHDEHKSSSIPDYRIHISWLIKFGTPEASAIPFQTIKAMDYTCSFGKPNKVGQL